MTTTTAPPVAADLDELAATAAAAWHACDAAYLIANSALIARAEAAFRAAAQAYTAEMNDRRRRSGEASDA